jgi:hypothetical protein
MELQIFAVVVAVQSLQKRVQLLLEQSLSAQAVGIHAQNGQKIAIVLVSAECARGGSGAISQQVREDCCVVVIFLRKGVFRELWQRRPLLGHRGAL